ncbi:hypothetical protein [Gordonia sputi]|uniref:hypothetical protein n=1 Tax=Gordonia sputi TaxID=36823 RepID=UPI0036CA1F22
MSRRSAFAIPSGARLVSFITGVMAILVGVIYFGPSEWVRRPLPPGQVSLVSIIESAVPVWSILFCLTGAALVFCVMSRRHLIAAHILAIFTWTFYGMALLLSAVLSEPPAPIVTGVIALGLVGVHWGLIQVHQEQGHDGKVGL